MPDIMQQASKLENLPYIQFFQMFIQNLSGICQNSVISFDSQMVDAERVDEAVVECCRIHRQITSLPNVPQALEFRCIYNILN